MPASERLYYSDSFLKAFTGEVTGVRELGTGGENLWQLSLNRTAFYPTSGGQPFDRGVFRATSKQGGIFDVPVDQVEEDEAGAVWHFVSKPLDVGAQIEGLIDWERRFDHMQQHTGQHLLSAVFLKELGAPTVSFHLGESSSTIDVTSAALAHHSVERVERIANEIIGEDRSVTIRYAERDEAESMLASGALRKLPEREGTIRLIDIADCDVNACGGTHVLSTGQIGGLLIRKIEKASRGVRVEFVCGLRAVRTARRDMDLLAETSAQLSTGALELPAAVERLLTEKKAGAKQRQKLHQELAEFQATQIATEAPIENGLRLVTRAWKDRDRDYVKLLASKTVKAAAATAVIFCAADAEPARVFVARSSDLDFNCGNILREQLAKLGLRGGGSADLAQGDVPSGQVASLQGSVSEAIRGAAEEAQAGR
ncbi:MAG TPA: DHHA1 domain-containing protein [Terracidiphilus sp.]|nr:DHHA1 domain-containing protein [Terracidiphilus sp.]